MYCTVKNLDWLFFSKNLICFEWTLDDLGIDVDFVYWFFTVRKCLSFCNNSCYDHCFTKRYTVMSILFVVVVIVFNMKVMKLAENTFLKH